MKVIEFSVKHSLFVNLLSVFLIVAGLVSMFQLRREAFPDVSYDLATIQTAYRGASADEVERLVSAKIEKELKEVDDIENIYSVSGEGFSNIAIEISADARDTYKVVNDIQKAVDRVTDLPDGVEDRPVVSEITSGKIAVIRIALSGAMDEFELRRYAEELQDEFEGIDGVASVSKLGWRDEEYWVEPDLSNMKKKHVSIEEIMESLRARNFEVPGGKLKENNQEYVVKVLSEFTTQEEIENVVIRANDAGNWLRVKDVATVRHAFEDEITMTHAFGTRAITLVVVKKQKGDAIKIVDSVYKIINTFKLTAPKELKISTLWDLSFYIKRRLTVLKFNGTIGLVFVVGILFLFLHRIPATMTALGIPVAMLTTLYVMNLLGISINLISMFGLIVVLGMIVDDGIIISENVYRYLEQGLSPREAAIKGASEVAAPVISTVLTTIAAFSPLLFMTGLLGKFIRNIPFVVIVALSASLLEAFIILPSHLADFCKPFSFHAGKTARSEKELRWLGHLRGGYRKLLITFLDHRYIVAGVVIGIFIGCLLLVKFVIPFVLFPSEGIEQFAIRAEAQKGTSLEHMSELMRPIEKFIEQIPPAHLESYHTVIGKLEEEGGYDPAAKTGSNLATITAYLTPSQGRTKSAKEIIEELRPGLKTIKENNPSFEKLYFREHQAGPPVGKAIDVRVRGEDFKTINEIVAQVKDFLSGLKGVEDLSDTYDLASQELRIHVDKEKATRAYLSVGEIGTAVRNALEGGIATTIKQSKAEEEIKVLVRLPKEQRDTRSVFENLLVRNKFDNLIPLREVAVITEQKTLRSIDHLDGKRYVSVNSGVDNKNMTSGKAARLIREKFKNIPNEYPGHSLRFGGEQEETAKSIKSLFIAFCIAVLLIFVILATQFNSLVQPAIVLLTIPFGMIGVVFGFLTHGRPFSFLAIMGIIGLSGVVVNDSIVLVDFINKMRSEGTPRRESIVEAGMLRLRPVLITTLTTVAGLSTVAYGIGGSDPFLKPMALAITWGLLFGTVLTLVVMPCFYAIVDDLTLKIAKHGTVQPFL